MHLPSGRCGAFPQVGIRARCLGQSGMAFVKDKAWIYNSHIETACLRHTAHVGIPCFIAVGWRVDQN
jgi:hypothetical protein